MTTQIVTWILGLLATVLGGLNIMQLLTFRAYKRQRNAEADQAEINSLSKIIERNQAEIGRLSQRVLNMDQRAISQEKRYDALLEKYDKLRADFEECRQQHSK